MMRIAAGVPEDEWLQRGGKVEVRDAAPLSPVYQLSDDESEHPSQQHRSACDDGDTSKIIEELKAAISQMECSGVPAKDDDRLGGSGGSASHQHHCASLQPEASLPAPR